MRFLYLLLVIAAFAGAVGIFADSACAQQNPLFQHPAGQITTQVVSCVPAQNYTHAPLMGPLSIKFAQGMGIVPLSLTDSTFVVMGQQSGWHRSSSLAYDSASSTITYIPRKPFFVGELVTAVATKKILYDSAGLVVPIHGFTWQFYGMVTRQTRATFVDTEHMDPGGFTVLMGLADMDEIGNLNMLYDHSSACIIAYNHGDGINYQNVSLNRAGNMFPADYRLSGLMDVIVGADSCTYDSNNNNRLFTYGTTQQFNAPSDYNALVDINFDGIPELITTGQGQDGGFDSVLIYTTMKNSVIKRQSIYLNDISLLTTGDFTNSGCIDICASTPLGATIFWNDGYGNFTSSRFYPNVGGQMAVDMDTDSYLDLVGVGGQGVVVYHNNQDSTFTTVYNTDGYNAVRYGFNIADCDGDGLFDCVYSVAADQMYIVTVRNIGNDKVSVTQKVPEGTSVGAGAEIFLGDLHHSGAMDAAISFDQSGVIAILFNDSSVAPVSVAEQSVVNPDGYQLNESFPNPAANIATITYAVPSPQNITVAVFNTAGQLVTTLAHGLVDGGNYSTTCDCTNIPTGQYYLQLSSSATSLTKQFTVIH